MLNNNIVKLNYKDKIQIDAISKLHQTLLPESIISQFGDYFMRNFYYKKLSQHNLIDSYLYKNNDKYVGFIVCTSKPFSFITEGMKKNFLYLSWILLISILTKPSRIFLLFKMNETVDLSDLKNEFGNKIGQFMSLGVLEDYRKFIDKKENITVPNVLMNKVFEHFRNENRHTFFLLVLKTNIVATKFYDKYSGIKYQNDYSESIMVRFDL